MSIFRVVISWPSTKSKKLGSRSAAVGDLFAKTSERTKDDGIGLNFNFIILILNQNLMFCDDLTF